jgi:hypothetical protein
MQTFEIVAQDSAADSGPSVNSSAKEHKSRVRQFHALGIKDHARLLLPFLVVGILGGTARLKYPYWWPATDLVFFVADCFIVVAFMGVLLELFSARLMVDRVSDGLAQRLIGRGLPSELQASIRDVVGTDLVTDHYVKTYAFSTPEDGYVSVDIEVRYELKNYSEAALDYAPEIAAELLFQPEFTFLEYGIAGRKIHTFSDENLSSKVETVAELNLRRVPRSALPPVSLKPVRTGEKSACQVTWRYRITVPDQYCELTEFGEATMGATLQIKELPEELEFMAGRDTSLHHEVGSQSWYFDRSFISGQHLSAWWFRKGSLQSSAALWRSMREASYSGGRNSK